MTDNKQYPDLPIPVGCIEYPGDQYEQPWVSTTGAYDEDQMRAYVDADRAMRAAQSEAPRECVRPTETVADLVNNLLLLDQTLPIYAAQSITHDGKRRTITVPPIVSRERVKEGRWIGEGDELNSAVIWTRAAQPDSAAVAGPSDKWRERWYGSGGTSGLEGWSIVNDQTNALIVYLGREVSSEAVSEIVMAHNAAPTTQAPEPEELPLYYVSGPYPADGAMAVCETATAKVLHKFWLPKPVEPAVSQGDALRKALDFVQFCWRELPLNEYAEERRAEVEQILSAALALPQEAAPQPWPIAPDVSADLERSDWTPEEALRWYAAGKHYDTVPNGDGTSSARILDNGAVASNALKSLSREYAAHKGDVALMEAAPSQDAAPLVWPKERDVGRYGDMSPTAHMRVGLDSDNDVYVSVWDDKGGASIEFCNPGGGGGGKSSETRKALIALMVAMEADNAASPHLDWWARRNDAARTQAKEGKPDART